MRKPNPSAFIVAGALAGACLAIQSDELADIKHDLDRAYLHFLSSMKHVKATGSNVSALANSETARELMGVAFDYLENAMLSLGNLLTDSADEDAETFQQGAEKKLARMEAEHLAGGFYDAI